MVIVLVLLIVGVVAAICAGTFIALLIGFHITNPKTARVAQLKREGYYRAEARQIYRQEVQDARQAQREALRQARARVHS